MSQKEQELKCSANDEQINKMWSITTKMDEVLTHITTRKNLEHIMLTEARLKGTHHVISVYKMSRKGHISYDS